MILEKRINAFAELGVFLSQFQETENIKNDNIKALNEKFYDKFISTLSRARLQNPWFTEKNIRFSVKGIVKMLNTEVLKKWTNNYPAIKGNKTPKVVGIIMAGNIPLVGFHDFLSILISGNKLMAKLSSKDKVLMQFMAEILITIEPEFTEAHAWTKDSEANNRVWAGF